MLHKLPPSTATVQHPSTMEQFLLLAMTKNREARSFIVDFQEEWLVVDEQQQSLCFPLNFGIWVDNLVESGTLLDNDMVSASSLIYRGYDHRSLMFVEYRGNDPRGQKKRFTVDKYSGTISGDFAVAREIENRSVSIEYARVQSIETGDVSWKKVGQQKWKTFELASDLVPMDFRVMGDQLTMKLREFLQTNVRPHLSLCTAGDVAGINGVHSDLLSKIREVFTTSHHGPWPSTMGKKITDFYKNMTYGLNDAASYRTASLADMKMMCASRQPSSDGTNVRAFVDIVVQYFATQTQILNELNKPEVSTWTPD